MTQGFGEALDAVADISITEAGSLLFILTTKMKGAPSSTPAQFDLTIALKTSRSLAQ